MKNPHLLEIKTLSSMEWCDKDMVMLHVCFQLLSDCVEEENLLDGHTDWGHTEETRKIKTEIESLYRWWNERKENDVDEQQYEKDNEMLIRLIKIRKHLWT